MKIISFNTNNAQIDQKGIESFLEEHKSTTDIFFFQEAFYELELLILKVLSNFNASYHYKSVTEPDTFCDCNCFSPKIRTTYLKDITETKSLRGPQTKVGPVIYSKNIINGKTIHLFNVHAMSRPVDKLDDPCRIEACQRIIEETKNIIEPIIVAGDFNLLPQTKSIAMFEEAGFKNLIKDFGITNTRNEVVWRKYPNNKMYFSDYVFVKNGVKVNKFEVPYNEISDHLPMILEFEI